MAKIKNLINKYNSKIRIHKDIILLNNKTMKTIPVRFTNDITKEQYINCIDMSHLCKDKKTENLKNYCKEQKKYKIGINFFIYLLALLGAIHTIIFYINLFIK